MIVPRELIEAAELEGERLARRDNMRDLLVMLAAVTIALSLFTIILLCA